MKDDNFWKNQVKEGAVLDPVDRISEVLFGLIMLLSYTGSISVSSQSKEEVHELLWAALACNFAWGLVDGIMYLMDNKMERGHSVKLINKLRNAKTNAEADEALKEEIQPLVSALLSEEELRTLGNRIKELPPPSNRNLFTFNDFVSAGQIFLLVFFCTLPVALPFILFKDVEVALRVSNVIALIMLFSGGFLLAKYAGLRPYITALVYCLIGIVLVAITMALGG